MAAHASATFWPGGAIQAAVAGGIGGAIAVVAWVLGIPVLSGLLVVVGGFMVVMAVYTFIHEGRKTAKNRRTEGDPPLHG
jgi:Flp pilus assembly protein TadB